MDNTQSVSVQLGTGYMNTDPNPSGPAHSTSPKPALTLQESCRDISWVMHLSQYFASENLRGKKTQNNKKNPKPQVIVSCSCHSLRTVQFAQDSLITNPEILEYL